MLTEQEATVINQLITNMYLIQNAANILKNTSNPTRDDFNSFLMSLEMVSIPPTIPIPYSPVSYNYSNTTSVIDLAKARYIEIKY